MHLTDMLENIYKDIITNYLIGIISPEEYNSFMMSVVDHINDLKKKNLIDGKLMEREKRRIECRRWSGLDRIN